MAEPLIQIYRVLAPIALHALADDLSLPKEVGQAVRRLQGLDTRLLLPAQLDEEYKVFGELVGELVRQRQYSPYVQPFRAAEQALALDWASVSDPEARELGGLVAETLTAFAKDLIERRAQTSQKLARERHELDQDRVARGLAPKTSTETFLCDYIEDHLDAWIRDYPELCTPGAQSMKGNILCIFEIGELCRKHRVTMYKDYKAVRVKHPRLPSDFNERAHKPWWKSLPRSHRYLLLSLLPSVEAINERLGK
jgi:hypothetical protein